MPRWQWLLTNLSRRLWARASLIGALGVLAAMLAVGAERYLPWQLRISVSADAVDSVLNIIASSMLAVTTFSLSVMTSAYGSATSNVTPRATKLLMQDRVTQNALSTFIGSFLFSIVGIVVLKTGAYGDRGRAVLFVTTIAVIVLIVVALLRWIDHLTRLGRVGETTHRVEQAARAAIEARLADPHLGGTPLREPDRQRPEGAVTVPAETFGYVQHVDTTALAELADAADCDVYVAVLPGIFVYADTPLAHVAGLAMDAEDAAEFEMAVRRAFTIETERSFDQDPRFGLVVMSEISSRALSPGINDPGTAIDVIGRTTRLMSLWAKGCATPEPRYPRVHVPGLACEDLFEDAFLLIGRDGAQHVEVQLRLQKALAALARIGDAPFRAAARQQADLAFARAEAAGLIEADRDRLREVRG